MNFTDGHSSSSPETKHNPPPSTSTRVQVAARFRPVNKTEAGLPDAPVCEFGLYNSSVLVDDPTRNQSFHFSFDHILNTDTTQNGCYRTVASPLVDTVLSGINAAIIAYGQTGSGKSYSMMGYGEDKGIIPRAVAKIFDRISDTADATTTYHVECSMLEIYNEQIRDLFSSVPRNKMAKGGLKVRDSAATGPFVMGLTKNA